MLQEAVVGAVVVVAISGLGYGAKVVVDKLYLPRAELEMVADNIYIRQDVYQQTTNQKRIWELQDRIDSLRSSANYESRPLKPYELERIKGWQNEIRQLGGTPN